MDDCEILCQLIVGLSHYLLGFNHPRWRRISSIHSMFNCQSNKLGDCSQLFLLVSDLWQTRQLNFQLWDWIGSQLPQSKLRIVVGCGSTTWVPLKIRWPQIQWWIAIQITIFGSFPYIHVFPCISHFYTHPHWFIYILAINVWTDKHFPVELADIWNPRADVANKAAKTSLESRVRVTLPSLGAG